jgi:hypothetical protein
VGKNKNLSMWEAIELRESSAPLWFNIVSQTGEPCHLTQLRTGEGLKVEILTL